MLRVYQGGRAKIEIPLSHRRALLLGSDLVRLAAEPLLQADSLLLKPSQQGRVAKVRAPYSLKGLLTRVTQGTCHVAVGFERTYEFCRASILGGR